MNVKAVTHSLTPILSHYNSDSSLSIVKSVAA